MVSKIDRVGEENSNNFGSKMVIVGYKSALNLDVYFPKYNWIAKNKEYKKFKNGNIKCPYEKRYYGVGYLGEGDYKASENGKHTKCYKTWYDMLRRCYDEKYHERQPTYIDCEVDEEWLCYTNFGDWFKENYYEIEGQKMCLDKDILHKSNKIYSPDTCVFVPQNINKLFTKNDNNRGEYPIGVYYDKATGKFKTYCNIYDFKENKTKRKHLGYYNTPEDAFKSYKQFKERYIKEVAEYYKNLISKKLYDALCNYKVEITD